VAAGKLAKKIVVFAFVPEHYSESKRI